MKNFYRSTMILLILASLFCVANASALAQKPIGFYVSISETRTEHSRDSGSNSKTIKINGNALVFEETSRRRKPLHKEYRLTDQEVSKLKRLVSERHLLASRSVEYPEVAGPHTSIALSLELKSKRRHARIRISGSMASKELNNDHVYQNAHELLDEITEMMTAKDQAERR